MFREWCAGSAVLCLAASLASAQTWSQGRLASTNKNAPPPRFAGAMVYDPVRGASVMFSGLGASIGGPLDLNDTWILNSPVWQNLNPTTPPPPRYGANMAYDSLHSQIVMFAGANFENNGIIFSLNDTWTLTGTSWTQKSPATPPPVRYFHGMAYDAARNQTVVFGGVNSNGYLGDTWVYDGTNWTQKSPANSPAPRSSVAMAYDPIRQVVVLYGGVNLSGSLSDTWTWNGTSWTQQTPAVSPPPRYGMGFAFDQTLGQEVMFAGTTSTGNLADTWEWNGSSWLQLFPAKSPPMRFFTCMDFDLIQNEMVLFAGGQGTNFGDIYLNDTWYFQ